MQLSNDAIFFRSADGEMFVYGDSRGRPLLLSPDGSKFFELHNAGFGGSSEEHELSFEDPHHNKRGKIHRLKNELELDGKKYHKVDGQTEVEVVLLPTIRQPEYLFVLPDGQYLYVSADKYRYSYQSFKLFVGPRDAMRQIPIARVMRARDGGTTYVETGEGTLFSPTPFNKDAKTTWKDEIELTKVDPKQFNIVENDHAMLQAA